MHLSLPRAGTQKISCLYSPVYETVSPYSRDVQNGLFENNLLGNRPVVRSLNDRGLLVASCHSVSDDNVHNSWGSAAQATSHILDPTEQTGFTIHVVIVLHKFAI